MLTASRVLDNYYLDTRCMLIEVAAMLDRYDRAAEKEGAAEELNDPRRELIQKALALLADPNTGQNRAEQLLLLFSDPA